MNAKEELIKKIVDGISSRITERLAPNIPASLVENHRNNLGVVSPVRAWLKYHNKIPLTQEETKVLDTLQWATDIISIPVNISGNLTRTNEADNLVPTRVADVFVEQLGDWNVIRENCQLIQSSTGDKIRVPKVDDRSNTADWLTSSGVDMSTSVGPSITSVTLDAKTVTSKPIVIDNSLIRDSAIDLEALLARIIAERIGRFANNKATVGSGSGGDPTGIVNSVPTMNTSAAGTISYDDIVDLVFSIEEPYLSNAKFMMNSATRGYLYKIKDSNNHPLFVPDPTGKPEGTILGFPIVVNRDTPSVAGNNKPIVFGDLTVYAYREVATLQLAILKERFIEFNSLGFLAFYDFDCALLATSTTGSIKSLTVKAS